MQPFTLAPVAAAATETTALYSNHFADVLHRIQNGQSTSVGVGGRYGNQYTTGLYGCLMFNTGMRVDAIDGGGTPTSIVPAVETLGASNYGETGVVAGCNSFLEGLSALTGIAIANLGFVMFASTGGRGGANIAAISKGTQYYTDMIAMVSNAYALNLAANRTYAVVSQPITIGEADFSQANPPAVFKTTHKKYITDFIADTVAITRQSLRPIIMLSQLASHMHYYSVDPATGFRPTIALAQRELALELADVFTVCPRYILTYIDDVHHDSFGYTLKNKYFGYAEAEIVAARLRGETRKPVVALDFKSALWQGTLVDLLFSVPPALPGQAGNPISFDTTQVAAENNMGFDLWSADGTTLLNIISSVTIKGPNRVVVRFSSVPPAGARLSYAFGRPGVHTGSGPEIGARGNLRDNRGSVRSYVDFAGKTTRCDSWLQIFETIKP